MKMTINQLRQTIANMESDSRRDFSDLGDAVATDYIQEVGSTHEEPMTDVPNYMFMLGQALASSEKLIAAKGVLAELNATVKFPVNGTTYSLASAIAALQIKRNTLRTIDYHLQRKASKQRIDKPNTPAYWRSTKLNLDAEEMKKLQTSLRDEIDAIEAAVDKANNREYDIVL